MIVWVDTDAAVPQLVSHLRIDVLRTSDRSTISKLDIARPDPADWPSSFGLWESSDTTSGEVLVRLRAYPEGRVDDDGNPNPGVTIDRLVRISVAPNVVTNAHVTLRGECFGTPVDLAARTSCISTTRELESPAVEQTTDDGPRKSVNGTFAVAPCTAKTRDHVDGIYQDEECLPGGAFLFGNREVIGSGSESGLPERVVVVSPIRMDRFEVTVGRWRDAVARGFVAPGKTPASNNGPVGSTAQDNTGCTYSDAPMGRESYPLNCVTVGGARAFCKWAGGELTSEAQWEYAAQVVGRVRKSAFPWGDDFPDCDRAVYARTIDVGAEGRACLPGHKGGPAPVDTSGDTTSPDDPMRGIIGLGGNVNEFMLDAHASLSSACWTDAPLRDPVCLDDTLPVTLRGGFWGGTYFDVRGSNRGYEGPPVNLVATGYVPYTGFRCVRPGVE